MKNFNIEDFFSDESVVGNLEALWDLIEPIANLDGEVLRYKQRLEETEAQKFLESEQSSVEAKKMEARTSPEYKKAHEEYANIRTEDTRARREYEVRKINVSVWQSVNKNLREGQI